MNRDYLFHGRHNSLIYIDLSSLDICEFVESLHLQDYADTEISARLILVEHPEEIAQIGDIDTYELHNLLKKTEKTWNTNKKYDITFKRAPFISFGNADRERQITELLFSLAPISCDEFYASYEELYGAQANTVAAVFGTLIDVYKLGNMYVVDQPDLSDPEREFLIGFLNTSDFHFMEDVSKAFIARFGESSKRHLNSMTLKMLGFKLYSVYILRDSWQSADDYLRAYLTSGDILRFDELDPRFRLSSTFLQTLYALRTDYELLDYEEGIAIPYRRFSGLIPGFSKDLILDYVDHVRAFACNIEFFTVRYILRNGFDHALHSYGLPEWFYISLLRYSKKIKYFRFGKGIIFYQGDETEGIEDLIRSILTRPRKLDIYDLIDLLQEQYGLNTEMYKITEAIGRSGDLYFNKTMEKVYITEEEFYEDI